MRSCEPLIYPSLASAFNNTLSNVLSSTCLGCDVASCYECIQSKRPERCKFLDFESHQFFGYVTEIHKRTRHIKFLQQSTERHMQNRSVLSVLRTLSCLPSTHLLVDVPRWHNSTREACASLPWKQLSCNQMGFMSESKDLGKQNNPTDTATSFVQDWFRGVNHRKCHLQARMLRLCRIREDLDLQEWIGFV